MNFREEVVINKTVKICAGARKAQDRISNEVKEVKTAWQSRFQKGEDFLANKSKIYSCG